jgi:hypothetical protein
LSQLVLFAGEQKFTTVIYIDGYFNFCHYLKLYIYMLVVPFQQFPLMSTIELSVKVSKNSLLFIVNVSQLMDSSAGCELLHHIAKPLIQE